MLSRMRPEEAARLRRVVTKLARALNASAAAADLTPSQASALGLIVARAPLGVAELAEIEGLNPTMVSRIVRKLTEMGLVTRVPGPEDLRTVTVEPTQRGRTVSRRILAARDAIVADRASRLAIADIAAISAALDALENLAEELQLGGRIRT
jgi:DNA-binding MarR family transcriptional regulator